MQKCPTSNDKQEQLWMKQDRKDVILRVIIWYPIPQATSSFKNHYLFTSSREKKKARNYMSQRSQHRASTMAPLSTSFSDLPHPKWCKWMFIWRFISKESNFFCYPEIWKGFSRKGFSVHLCYYGYMFWVQHIHFDIHILAFSLVAQMLECWGIGTCWGVRQLWFCGGKMLTVISTVNKREIQIVIWTGVPAGSLLANLIANRQH